MTVAVSIVEVAGRVRARISMSVMRAFQRDSPFRPAGGDLDDRRPPLHNSRCPGETPDRVKFAVVDESTRVTHQEDVSGRVERRALRLPFSTDHRRGHAGDPREEGEQREVSHPGERSLGVVLERSCH